MTVLRSKTIGVSIERPPAEIHSFVSDPANLPAWAAGLGRSVKRSAEGWLVETESGWVRIRFAPPNEFGILDHYVTLPGDPEVLVPMRVMPNGTGSEVIFTVFQPPEMSDAQFAEDVALVEHDLRTLKRVMET